MRVILVYTTLILAVYGATVAGGVWVAIWLPIKLFSITGYATVLFWIGGVIASTVIVVIMVYGVCKVLVLVGHETRQVASNIHHMRSPVVHRGLNFGELVVEWLIAKKQMVCPQITFADQKSAEGGTQ